MAQKNMIVQKNVNRSGILILVLVVLVIGAVSYIGYTKYAESKNAQLGEAYVVGYNEGITAAAVSLFQQTEQCQTPTAITVGNFTKQLIDTRCLQQG